MRNKAKSPTIDSESLPISTPPPPIDQTSAHHRQNRNTIIMVKLECDSAERSILHEKTAQAINITEINELALTTKKSPERAIYPRKNRHIEIPPIRNLAVRSHRGLNFSPGDN